MPSEPQKLTTSITCPYAVVPMKLTVFGIATGTVPAPVGLSPRPTVAPLEATSCVQAVLQGMFAGARLMIRKTNAFGTPPTTFQFVVSPSRGETALGTIAGTPDEH